MRAATATAREPRGERTLMGIGPEFFRREIVSSGVSGTLDGVPRERMDRTPSSPIVVEPQAVSSAPTVRMPVTSPARTVQLSRGAAEALPAPTSTGGTPSRRLDSLMSARFFQEGEQQEANGWEDSPLVNEPFPDEEPPKFSSFDRVPHRRGPLIVTTFLLGTALVSGLALEGVGAGAARTWLATEAGPRAVGVWKTAKTHLETGLSLRLTPESTVASPRAMVAPAGTPSASNAVVPAPPAVAGGAPVVPSAGADTAGEPSTADDDLWAPLIARPVVADVAIAHRSATTSRNSVEVHLRAAATPADASVHKSGATPRAVAVPPETTASTGDEEAVASSVPSSEPKPDELGGRAAPRRGQVWSPAQQRLVRVQPALANPPETAEIPPTTDDKAGPSREGDTGVLPLDDEPHTTY